MTGLAQLEAKMNQGFAEIDKRFDDLYALLSQFANDMQAKFEEQDARFDRIEARLDKQDARFDRIEARLDEHDARFDRIEKTLDKIMATLDAVVVKIDNQRTDQALMEHRLDRLERWAKLP